MIKILIIFILVIFLLVLLITVAVIRRSRNTEDTSYTQFLDEQGNHTYYDRRVIRSKQKRDNQEKQ